ncbi:speckle-type POZ protein B-like [Ornithodoros turicata]|uniref:speckle-type POZ protein B-like n=1 Tax=Ornithodoros turicata TaxID=34597 RepID=UPI003138CDFD
MLPGTPALLKRKYHAAFPTNETRTVTQVKTSTCSHKWVIRNFSSVLLECKRFIDSTQFSHPDYPGISWRLKLYPHGSETIPNGLERKKWLSVYLQLAACDTESVGVKCEFSIVRNDGKRTAQTNAEMELSMKQPTWGHARFMDKVALLKDVTTLLPGGVLTIVCDVTMRGQITHTALRNEGVVAVKKCDLRDDFSHLYRTGTLSDFTISVSDKEFRVHKAVLAARSPVFLAMLESPTKESEENRMVIEDLRSDVIEQMLEFMYTGTTSEIDSMAEELLRAADKYQLPSLKMMCAQHLQSQLYYENAADILQLADTYNVPELKSSMVSYISMHAKEVVGTEGWRRLVKMCPESVTDIITLLAASK